jgi:hypothetical protein
VNDQTVGRTRDINWRWCSSSICLVLVEGIFGGELVTFDATWLTYLSMMAHVLVQKAFFPPPSLLTNIPPIETALKGRNRYLLMCYHDNSIIDFVKE